MNCFQQTPESCDALRSPCGGASQQRGPLTPQHALIGITPTPPTQAPFTPALAHASSLASLTARATHALPLHPAALASVPYGIILVRIQVHSYEFFLGLLAMIRLRGIPRGGNIWAFRSSGGEGHGQSNKKSFGELYQILKKPTTTLRKKNHS